MSTTIKLNSVKSGNYILTGNIILKYPSKNVELVEYKLNHWVLKINIFVWNWIKFCLV